MGVPLVIQANKISIVLKKYIIGVYSSQEIEQWANLIECREDLGYESDKSNVLDSIVYHLANPFLEGKITRRLCLDFMKSLDKL